MAVFRLTEQECKLADMRLQLMKAKDNPLRSCEADTLERIVANFEAKHG